MSDTSPLPEPHAPLLPATATNSSHAPVSGLFRSTTMSQSMGAYLPATVAARVLNLARILLLAWTMRLHEFGLLQMILIVVNVLTPLAGAGLHDALVRYVPMYEEHGGLARLARMSLGLMAAIGVFVVGVMVAFAEPLGRFFFVELGREAPAGVELTTMTALPVTMLTAGLIAVQCVYFYLLSLAKGLRMFVALSWLELSHSILFLAGAGAAIAFGWISALALGAVYGASIVLPSLYFGVRMAGVVRRQQSQTRPPDSPPGPAGLPASGALASRLLRYGLWAMLAGVTWQVLLTFAAWNLGKKQGHDAMAIFGAVRQLSQFILVAAVALSTVVMTAVIKTWESRGPEAAERQLSLAFRGCGLGLLMGCGVLAVTREWIMLAFRPDYAVAAPTLPLHLLFFLLGAYLAFLPGHFYLREKARMAFWPWAAGVAINVALAAWLVPVAGVASAGAGQPAFRAVSSAASAASIVLTAGLEGPFGLGAAAWCAALAMLAATALCAALVRLRCTRLDGGTWIVLASAPLLALRPALLMAGMAILLVLALTTGAIFSRDERRRVAAFLRESLRHALPARRGR